MVEDLHNPDQEAYYRGIFENSTPLEKLDMILYVLTQRELAEPGSEGDFQNLYIALCRYVQAEQLQDFLR